MPTVKSVTQSYYTYFLLIDWFYRFYRFYETYVLNKNNLDLLLKQLNDALTRKKTQIKTI